MTDERKHYLIEKFLAGNATHQEKAELNSWYKEHTENLGDIELTQADSMASKGKMLSELNRHLAAAERPVIRLTQRKWLKVAAVIIVTFLIGTLFYVKGPGLHTPMSLQTVTVIAPANKTENRYVLLPDSSVIVLHAGSKANYHFDGQTRSVNLEGEAFFDVKHHADRPFVIYSGKVVTTVLGTAFNIKAYKGRNVTISVTRGKVSVADVQRKLLAVLIPNQQVEYSTVNKKAKQQAVESSGVIEWTGNDMQFDDLPFKELARKLERRYGATISFKNPAMENCLITGRFSGTESLNKLLELITKTMNSTYTLRDSVILIDGPGCEN